MSYPYTPRHNNPYMNTPYQNIPYQNTKMPQTLLHQSPTPQKQILQRNQSFENRHYNEDLIQLIAKIRSLQDDLINERFKNQNLQRKLSESEMIIDNLQYELNAQSYQLQKYLHEIELSNEKNVEILKYEQNLKIVGEEIEELNNVLVRRNKDYDQLYERNRQLEYQLKKWEEDNHLLRVNQSMWKKDVDTLVEEYGDFIDSTKEQAHQATSYNKVFQQLNNLPQNNFSPLRQQKNFSSSRQQNNFSPQRSSQQHYHQNQQSLTFNMTTTNEDMNKKLFLIKNICTTLVNEMKLLQKQLDLVKKEMSAQLIKEKEKFIKLQYEHKLLEERVNDDSKKQDLISSYYNEQKVEEIIQQLMKKEDEYIKRIEELTLENDELKQQIASTEENNQYLEKIDSQEKNSIIQSLRRENQFLDITVNQLTQKINSMEAIYEDVIAEKQEEIQIQTESVMRTNKKSRKLEEENYHYQIKLEELTGEVNMLKKQITILKGEEQEQQ